MSYSSSVGFAFFPGLIYVNAPPSFIGIRAYSPEWPAEAMYVHTQLLNAKLHKNDAIMSQ